MSSRFISALALVLMAGSGAIAAAPPDPADVRLGSRAPLPPAPAKPSSAAVADPGVGDWRAANRRVLEAGGWRALARERSASAPPSAPAAGHHQH